jgi:MFS family permease
MVGKQAPQAWAVLGVLLAANILNYFDRSIPAILTEPIRREFGLSDLQIGLIASGFTLVYAVAGVPLGRLGDLRSRKTIIGIGLLLWSVFTGLSGFARGFGSYFVLRMAVGVGEASYAPAAMSLVADLFPADRRSRAMGVYWLGLPIGLVLAFFTTGAVAKSFGSWRAPFFLAAVPGVLVALIVFAIREPARGAAEQTRTPPSPIDRPIWRMLRIPTLWWITLAAIPGAFATYASGAFLVPLLQRYFGLPLQQAAVDTGIIIGVTGLVGLTLGGWIGDTIHRRYPGGRLLFGAVSLGFAALATWYAMSLNGNAVALFTAIFSAGWLLQYAWFTSAYPAIHDVVEPRLRSYTMAIYLATHYVLGGAFGPVLVGALSDRYSQAAMRAAGATVVSPQFKAEGLHDAMYLIPAALLLTAISLYFASRTFQKDADAMPRSMMPASIV